MKPIVYQLTGARNSIRLIRMGCTNRPFYQIGVSPINRRAGLPPNEVIGSYDPMPNEHNEKHFAVDLDRLAYWLGEGAAMSAGVSTLLGNHTGRLRTVQHELNANPNRTVLGLAGYLPIKHQTFRQAWINRAALNAGPPPEAAATSG